MLKNLIPYSKQNLHLIDGFAFFLSLFKPYLISGLVVKRYVDLLSKLLLIVLLFIK